MPQYRVALGSKGNTRGGIIPCHCGGNGGGLWLVGEEVESVSGGLEHTHSCGNNKQANVKVIGEDEFTTVVGPADT